jgi:hypothetical protein
MLVSQQWGSSTITASSYFPADQWMEQFVSSSTISITRNGGIGGSNISISAAPAETSAAAGEYVWLGQPIEGYRIADFLWGTGTAKAAVAAFDVYAPVAGTYWVSIQNSPQTHSFNASYAIAAGELNTWVRRTVAIPAGAINAGTWVADNTQGAWLFFTVHCGSSYTGVAGFQAGVKLVGPGAALGLSTANPFVLRNVGLYLDPLSTGVAPPWVAPDYAQELEACRRYYGSYRIVCGGPYVTAGDNFHHSTLLPVSMRIPPAVAATSITATNCSGLSTYWVFEDTLGTYATATASGRATYQAVFNCNARM